MTSDLTRALARRLMPLSLVVVMAVWAASMLQAYPEPRIASKNWSLSFTHSLPRPIQVVDSTTGKQHWYWYITYKVVNKSGEELLFVPEVSISTEAGDLVDAGHDVPATVFPAIKTKEGNKLLESPSNVVGHILQGEDYAKESVIIWPAFDHTVNRVSVFVAGLSGESSVAKNPTTGQDVAVRKTLMLDYFFPGTDVKPQDQQVVGKGEEWVMR